MRLRQAEAGTLQVAAIRLIRSDMPVARVEARNLKQGALGRRQHAVLVPSRAQYGARAEGQYAEQPSYGERSSHEPGIVARRN